MDEILHLKLNSQMHCDVQTESEVHAAVQAVHAHVGNVRNSKQDAAVNMIISKT